MIRVAVLGAAGRMGRLVCRTVAEASDLSLVAAVDPSFVGEPMGPLIGLEAVEIAVAGDLEAVSQASAQVVVDFTAPDAVMDNVRWAVAHGVHAVVGTTGVRSEDLEEIRRLLAGGSSANVIVVPNFAIGAVLMQRFSEMAARFFPAAEIIELHHEGKVDAPSGTALATAERIARARGEDPPGPGPGSETLPGVRGGDARGVRIHSVRLPGLVAHQEVIFGGIGQVLTIRHDSPQRDSFMPGVLLAIASVAERPGLTVGLDPLLGLPADQA